MSFLITSSWKEILLFRYSGYFDWKAGFVRLMEFAELFLQSLSALVPVLYGKSQRSEQSTAAARAENAAKSEQKGARGGFPSSHRSLFPADLCCECPWAVRLAQPCGVGHSRSIAGSEQHSQPLWTQHQQQNACGHMRKGGLTGARLLENPFSPSHPSFPTWSWGCDLFLITWEANKNKSHARRACLSWWRLIKPN